MILQFGSALLISDLHLTPSMPLTAQRFFDFCEKEATKVEAVFILGDLFEYWVGDDAAASSPFQQEVQRTIANLSTKVQTYYLHGNRDFLIGKSFLKRTGMTLLADPTAVEIASHKWVLAHGDALCTADIAYQTFRNWVRKPWAQKIFLNLPVNWRKGVAQQLRTNSHGQYPSKQRSESHQRKMDVTREACAAILRDQVGDRLIHGHTHLPAHHEESLGAQSWQRWVLSDWDLDHPESLRPKASALLIDSAGVRYLDLIKH